MSTFEARVCLCGGDVYDAVTYRSDGVDEWGVAKRRAVHTKTCACCHRRTIDGKVVDPGKVTRPAPVPLKR